MANVAAVAILTFVLLLALRVVATGAAAVFTRTSVAVATALARTGEVGASARYRHGRVDGCIRVRDTFGHRGRRLLQLAGSVRPGGRPGNRRVLGISAFLPVLENPPLVSLCERLGVVGKPAVFVTLSLTATGLGCSLVVFMYIGALLRGLTGFGEI